MTLRKLMIDAPLLVTEDAFPIKDFSYFEVGQLITFGTRKTKWKVVAIYGQGTNQDIKVEVVCIEHPATALVGQKTFLFESTSPVWLI